MPYTLTRFPSSAGLLLALALAGCGDLPHPFQDNPGATAVRLSQPPPARLAIPMPTASLLPDDAARSWSSSLADVLQAKELPVSANQARRGDWRLVLTAEIKGDTVVPTYTVVDPKGKPQGNSEGPPVPASDWAAGQPATFKAAADAEAPKILALLNGIEAQEQQSDPNSLLNRPPKIFFAGVTGAPGDGNTSLTREMTTRLPNLGDVVQDTMKGADFSVAGQIKTAPEPDKKLRVEIQWIVTDAKGQERGRVVQLNEVPQGSLDNYWGDVALVVAQEAAGGVHEIVLQAAGREKPAGPDKPAAPDKPAGPAKPTVSDKPTGPEKPTG